MKTRLPTMPVPKPNAMKSPVSAPTILKWTSVAVKAHDKVREALMTSVEEYTISEGMLVGTAVLCAVAGVGVQLANSTSTTMKAEDIVMYRWVF